MVSVSGGDLTDPWQLLARAVFHLLYRCDRRYPEHVKIIIHNRGYQIYGRWRRAWLTTVVWQNLDLPLLGVGVVTASPGRSGIDLQPVAYRHFGVAWTASRS